MEYPMSASDRARDPHMNRANVWWDDQIAGTLHRGEGETVFRYHPGFGATRWPGGGIATSLPREIGEVKTSGTRLPAFFANLQPEGYRAEALFARTRFARDDSFGIMLAIGADCVGNVSVLPEGKTPNFAAPDFRSDDFEASLEKDLEANATVPGVQEKVSSQTASYPVCQGREGAILKLDPPRFPHLTANEAFFMNLSRECGLATAETRLLTDKKGGKGLLVRRFDRGPGVRFPQEDGCQIADIYPGAKYGLSLRHLADRMVALGAATEEIVRLLEQYAFAWLIGNGDQHAKNFSCRLDASGAVTLSPVYDMLSTLPYRDLDPRAALKIDGRDSRFKRKTFASFFARYGVSEEKVGSTLDRLLGGSEAAILRLEEIGYDEKTT
ncbi:type II toxin-antitoxin system HipA family toxin, partial [bacterium]